MSPTLAIITSSIIMLAIGVGISIYIGKKQKGIENWNVGGRSLPMYVIAGTQFATGVGGGVLVAHVGIGYHAGWSAFTYNLLYSLGIVVLILFAGWLKKHQFSTLPDIFKKLYGEHKVLISTVTLLSIVVPFGWLCTQLVAFGNLFTEITGISFTLLVVIFAFISILFVLPGGMASVAWTDFLFGCFMLILSIATGLYILNFAGGWSEIVANVPEKSISFPQGMGAVGLTTIILWTFAIFPGALTNQMSYQRIYSAKDPKSARQGFVIAAIAGLISGLWASFMGIAIHSLNPNLDNPEMAAGWFLTQVPTWFLAIYSAFIIATIISTVSSAVQSVVVNITNDIYKSYINPNVNEKTLVKYSRILTVFIIILALILALYYPQALGWLQATYAYSAAGLLVPIFLGIFLRKTKLLSVKGALGGTFSGVVGVAIAQILNTTIPYSVYGVVCSLIGFLLFSAIYRNKELDKGKVTNI